MLFCDAVLIGNNVTRYCEHNGSDHYYSYYLDNIILMIYSEEFHYTFFIVDNKTKYRIKDVTCSKFIRDGIIPGTLMITKDNYLQVIDRIDSLQAFL